MVELDVFSANRTCGTAERMYVDIPCAENIKCMTRMREKYNLIAGELLQGRIFLRFLGSPYMTWSFWFKG